MVYYDLMPKRVRTIETLDIYDIMEIVIRDFQRYGVPDSEINEFIAKHVIPLRVESDKLKLKYEQK